MPSSTVLVALLVMTAVAYALGRRRSASSTGVTFHSLPGYYGSYVAIWCALPALVLYCLWQLAEPGFIRTQVLATLPVATLELPEAELGLVYNDIRNLVEGNIVSGEQSDEILAAASRYMSLQRIIDLGITLVVLLVGLASLGWAFRRVEPGLRARNKVERTIEVLLMAASTVAIFTTIGIFLSVLFEALRFFQQVSPLEFLFGLSWSPQTAIRPDQVGSSGAFGAVPLFAGTLLISGIAMLVAVPVGLMSAIYLSEYANSRVRSFAKPMLEVLAGIPTVVYGYFAALTVGPLLRPVRRRPGAQRFVGERARRRPGDGDHDHPLCFFPFR